MKTLYLRNVPDDVVERLRLVAEREGISVNAVAVRELAQASARAHNPALLAALPAHRVDLPDIVAGLREDRESR